MRNIDLDEIRFDPNSTENQGRYRLKDPDDFSRMWTKRDPRAKGINYIVGTLKGGGYATQAIRFDKDAWSEDRATQWWKKNKGRFKRTWRSADWKLKEAKDFGDREHNWDQVIIKKDGKKITRGQIKSYYMRNIDKLFDNLRDKDIIVILGMGTNKFVLKRNIDSEGNRIHIKRARGIDDQQSLEYWINRRAVEFHEVIGDRTDHVWVDVDVHYTPKEEKRMITYAKKIAREVAAVLRKNVAGRVRIWSSGKTGYHVIAELPRPMGVNRMRKEIRDMLDDEFRNEEDVTTGIARGNMIRLDVTTLKRTGSLRAPYSMTVTGGIKRPASGK